MSYQSLLNAVAQVVGGSQPNAAQVLAGSGVSAAKQPYWFSGADVGDNSGVAGLVGCFSLPTEEIQNTPVALVLSDSWSPLDAFPMQGKKYEEDRLHVRVMTGHADLQTQLAQLVNFRDSVPTAFDTHMTLLGAVGVDTAWCSDGVFLEVEWPVGTVYMALQFLIRVHRATSVTRS